MSWDAFLVAPHDPTGNADDCCKMLAEFNYTTNCNRAANLAAERAGYDLNGRSWLNLLHGLDALEGGRLLRAMLDAMGDDPAAFAELDPPNGWGQAFGEDSLFEELDDMMRCVGERPASWVCCW